MEAFPHYTVFIGQRRVASGTLPTAMAGAKAAMLEGVEGPVAVFDNSTGQELDVDLRGIPHAVARRAARVRGKGRPNLGVVAREVTLLPRHWVWLGTQPGGASAALRKLIDAARHVVHATEAGRRKREAAYAFMTEMAGNLPGFEEASRALFADELPRFRDLVAAWPCDIREHAIALASGDATARDASAQDASAQDASAHDAVAAAVQASAREEWAPADRRPAVHRALQAAFGDAPVDAVERLPGGSSGPAAVYRISVASREYVLRIEGPPDGLRDPARQFECHRVAAAAGVAPPLIHAHAGDGISIAQFIRSTAGADSGSLGSRLVSIVNAVKSLHAAPLFPPLMPYLDCVGGLMRQVDAMGILPAAVLRRHEQSFGEVVSVYPRKERDIVSSHNDLNPSNVLFAGSRPWFVDWESAFATDRFVDLAAVTNFFGNSLDGAEIVLRTYFGAELNYHHRAQLYLMRYASHLFYAMVLLSAVAAAQPDVRITAAQLQDARRRWPTFEAIRGSMASLATHEGRLRFACAFLNDAARDLTDDRFSESLLLAPD